MKTLIISDIHANFTALQAILDCVKYDRLICLGDIIAYGPQPCECIDMVFAKSDVVIMGNHDENILRLYKNNKTPKALHQGARWDFWTARQLGEKRVAKLATVKKHAVIEENGKKSIYIHNIANNDYVYPKSSKAVFEKFSAENPADFVFFGHSHIPFIRKIEDCTFTNPGSIGQARHGIPDACCAILENNKIKLLSVRYDPSQTLNAMKKTPLHKDYINLWEKFYKLGIVDSVQLNSAEKKIRTALKSVSLMEKVNDYR